MTTATASTAPGRLTPETPLRSAVPLQNDRTDLRAPESITPLILHPPSSTAAIQPMTHTLVRSQELLSQCMELLQKDLEREIQLSRLPVLLLRIAMAALEAVERPQLQREHIRPRRRPPLVYCHLAGDVAHRYLCTSGVHDSPRRVGGVPGTLVWTTSFQAPCNSRHGCGGAGQAAARLLRQAQPE